MTITISKPAKFSLLDNVILVENDRFFQGRIEAVLWCNERECYIYQASKSGYSQPVFVEDKSLFNLPDGLEEKLKSAPEDFFDTNLQDFDEF